MQLGKKARGKQITCIFKLSFLEVPRKADQLTFLYFALVTEAENSMKPAVRHVTELCTCFRTFQPDTNFTFPVLQDTSLLSPCIIFLVQLIFSSSIPLLSQYVFIQGQLYLLQFCKNCVFKPAYLSNFANVGTH